MSKLSRVEASRTTKHLLASIPIIFLLILTMLACIPIQSTHATYTNNLTNDNAGSSTGSSFTITSQTGITSGDLLILEFKSRGTIITGNSGSSAHNEVYNVNGYILTLTDSSGDIWHTISTQDITGYPALDNSLLQIFYTRAVTTSTGTISITMSTTTSSINWIYGDYNVGTQNIYSIEFTGGAAVCVYGQPYGSGVPTGKTCVFGNNAELTSLSTFVTNKISVPSDSITVALGETSCDANAGSGTISTYANTFQPLTYGTAYIYLSGCTLGTVYPLQMYYMYSASPTNFVESWIYSQYSITNSVGINLDSIGYYQTYSCTVNQVTSTCYEWDLWGTILSVTFSGTGGSTSTPATIYTNGCSFNPILNGTTNYVSLISNETYLYYGQSATSQIFLNFTVYIHAVTAYPSGDVLNLNLYAINNQNSVSSANELSLVYTKQKTLQTTSTPYKISIGLSIALPTNGQYVFALSTHHNGIQLYKGNKGLTLYIDSVDGYNPTALSTIGTPQTTPICMFALIAMPSIITTIGGIGGTVTQGTITITQVTTSFIYSLQGSRGSEALVQDVTAYLPLWIFPLIFGVWFGLIGLFMGLIIGVGTGTAFGIVPLWLAFLLGLGLLYMMSKLH